MLNDEKDLFTPFGKKKLISPKNKEKGEGEKFYAGGILYYRGKVLLR